MTPNQGGPTFSREKLEAPVRRLFLPLAGLVRRTGLGPNAVTVLSFAAALAAGLLAASGRTTAAGLVFLVSGPLDLLDGALARASGRVTRFGGFLDSFLDRYGEAAVLGGIAWLAAATGRPGLALLAVLALTGAFMVSYARARAEGLGVECRTGFMTRPERFVLLTLTLLTGRLSVGLALLAVLANLTALHRAWHVRRQTRD